MARRNIAFFLPSEGGPRVGGTNFEVRIYNGSSKTGAVASTLYADDTTASTLTQPLKPNAGAATVENGAQLAGVTVLNVVDTSGFNLGDILVIRPGGPNQEFRTIIALASNTITISQGTTNALTDQDPLGSVMMKGWVECWVDDSQDYTIEVKNVSTGIVMPRGSVPMKVSNSDLTKLASTTLGAPAASISFTGISTAFTHLELIYQLRSDTAALFQEVGVQFNADAAANYANQRMSASGAVQTDSESGAANLASVRAWYVTAANSAAGWAGSGRILIPNYMGTTFRKAVHISWDMLAIAAFPGAGQGFSGEARGWWNFTTAISRVDLVPIAGNFIAGSMATLYGRM